uniref:Solute carrier family 38 member 5a n=1 Tax=Cyprinus carpio TaxID=7962 RepID=A0A8C2L510_CYPCA
LSVVKLKMELQKVSNGHHNLSPERIPENGYCFKSSQILHDIISSSFNAIIGSGILGLAYAMANTGIIFFVILLILIAVLSAYSIHLLLESAGVVGIRAYEQLGYHAFGQPGKILAACIIILHNIGAMSSYLFIVKIELPHIIQGLWPDISDYWLVDGKYLIIIVSVIFILPLALMKQIGYLGYTSGFSLSCMVFFLISVSPLSIHLHTVYMYQSTLIMTDMSNMTNKNMTNKSISPLCLIRSSTRSLSQSTAFTIPIMAFAFVCHPEVLPIYTELKNPSKKRMQNVANISILVMSVMYLLTAIFGYLTFYGNVESELLEMYSKKDILILCVRLAVLIAVTLTVPVVLFPIRRAILQLLFPDKPFHWVRHISIAVCLLFLVNLLVIFVAKIRDIFGFIGATSAPSLIFILPGIFYICIVSKDKELLKSRPKIQAILFVTLGFILMIMSITFIIIEWVTGKKISGGH